MSPRLRQPLSERMRTRSLAVGLSCAALALVWQILTVQYNYGGNWTGLFCTGDKQAIPAGLLGEPIHALRDSYGYDGQYYHYIAHDPLARTELPKFVDAPKMRYGRILVPGLAWLLAGGQPRFIDRAYFAVVLVFVFLGGFWVAWFAASRGRSFLWGFLFLLTPAALVSVDRMTVDVALAALCAGLLAIIPARRRAAEYAILAAAPLARETGLALTAAYCLWAFGRRDWRRLVFGGLTAGPYAAWKLYLEKLEGGLPLGWMGPAPLRDLVGVIWRPSPYPWSWGINTMVIGADLLALAGGLAAVGLAFQRGRRQGEEALNAALLTFGCAGVVLAVAGSRDVWIHLYGYGRVLSPLMLLLMMRALTRGTRLGFMPVALTLPRAGLQFASDLLRVLRGVTSM